MKTAVSPRVVGLSRGLVLGLLGSTIAISAHAGGVNVGQDRQTMSVSYAGLDLRDPGGDAQPVRPAEGGRSHRLRR